jgi:hypothetical protein
MNDSKHEGPNVMAVATGAAVGALAIYVLRTPGGRRLLNTAIDLLDDFASECARFRLACSRAQAAMSDEWQTASSSTMKHTGGERETVF